jgi:hypothetical protein
LTTSTFSSGWPYLSGEATPDGERYIGESKLPRETVDHWPHDLELGGIAVTHEVEVVASSPVFPQWPLPVAGLSGGQSMASFGGGGGRIEEQEETRSRVETPSWLDDSSVHELEWRRSGAR